MKTNEPENKVTATASTFNRRSFVKGAGFTGLGLAGAAIIGSQLGGNIQKVAAASGPSDAAILNFALNLEYLEAEFYLMATFGTTLVKSGIITSADQTGPTTGGQMVPGFGKFPEAFMATNIRKDEVAHVQFLRSALGSGAVKKPAINLDALGFGFGGVHEFLQLARIFEDTGVSAYLGAAPLISSSTYLAAAAAILSTEAQHAGSVRLKVITNGISSPAFDSLDVPPTTTNLYDVDKNALSIPRTTAQVLNIVYGGGQCSGGFFPNGLNGEIACQS